MMETRSIRPKIQFAPFKDMFNTQQNYDEQNEPPNNLH